MFIESVKRCEKHSRAELDPKYISLLALIPNDVVTLC